MPPPKDAGKKDAKGAAEEKKGYVPPPPSAGTKIPPPAGMPKVKEFPVSSGAPPPAMSIPGVKSAEAEPANGSETPAAAGEEGDDGFTPEQRKKNELEQNPAFKKMLMMYRMKIPLAQIRKKIHEDKIF